MNQKGVIGTLLPIVLLLIGIIVAVYLSQTPQIFKPKAAEEVNQPYGKIVVQGKRLVDSTTGKEFKVRSVQYMKVYPTSVATFNAQDFNESYIDGHFTWMQNLGFNTVRLVYHNHEDGEKLLTSGATLCRTEPYQLNTCHDLNSLNNLVKTINIAKNHNLKIILTFYGGVPNRYLNKTAERPELYYLNNAMYLDPQTVADYARYLNDVLSYMKPRIDMSTILLIQPQAEPWLNKDQYPMQPGNELHPGEFNVTNTYPINEQVLNKVNGKSSDVMNQILQESMTNSFNKWFAEVKKVDDTLVTGYDQFPSYAVPDADIRHVYDYQLINTNLRAEVIGMQTYRYVPISTYATSTQAIDIMFNFYPGFKTALTAFQKPFLIWEMGYDNINMGEPNPTALGEAVITKDAFLKDWMKATCSLNPAGWNTFFWRHANSLDAGFETLDSSNFALARALGASQFQDPCLFPISSPLPSMSPASSVQQQKIGDIDQDGDVDVFDFNILIGDFRGTNLRSDLNNDGKVNIYDFNLLITNFGK